MKNTVKAGASLVGLVLLIAVMVAGAFWTFSQIGKSAEERKNSYIIINRAEDLLSELKDAETGQRGYLLTNDDAYLEPYLEVRDIISGNLEELRQLTVTSGTHKHLETLTPLIAAKLAELAHLIELRNNHDTTAALAAVVDGQGKALMDSIRVQMNSFIKIEEDALAQHNAMFQSNMRLMFIVIIAISLLALLFAFLFAYWTNQEKQQQLKNAALLQTQSLLDIQEYTNKQLLKANATLQLSEEKLIVTLSSIGDAVMATNAYGHVTLLNPVAEKLTGWTQADAAGRLVDEVFHIVNNETRQPVPIPIMETLAHGTIQGLANHTVLIARSGSECSIADSCAPIRDHNGQVVGAVLVFRDVSEEYATQQNLRDSNTLVRTILDTVVDGIINFNARGCVIETVNSATLQMFGYAAEELIGQNASILMPMLEKDPQNGFFEHLCATDDAHLVNLGREVDGRRKDGSVFPLEITVNKMLMGTQRYFTGILRDITERRQIENGLEKTRKELEIIKTSEDAAREYADSIINTVREPLISLNQDLRVVSASRSFYEVFKVNPEATVGQLIYDLGNKQWDIPKLRELLETILPQKATFG
ncbi:MAG: PAS domain S-box protein, partial [Candidatus Omnitrophota bacterium]